MHDSKRTLSSFALLLLAAAGLLLPPSARAQALGDGFFRGAGNGDVTVSTTYEQADQFFNGPDKVDVPPFYRELTRTTVSLFAAYGITDNVDVNLSVPYIMARGDGQAPAGETLPPQDFSSLQDGALTVKWRPVQAAAGPGTLSLVGAAGVSVPLADYETGAMTDPSSERPVLVAIGNRTTTVAGALLAQYSFFSGLFTSVQGGYLLKGTTGDNDDLDVPNAVIVSGKLGYGTGRYYGDVWIAGQLSTDGTDIGEGAFPTNQVNYTRLGVTGSVSIVPAVSLNAQLFTTIDGRNANASNGVSVGLTYKMLR